MEGAHMFTNYIEFSAWNCIHVRCLLYQQWVIAGSAFFALCGAAFCRKPNRHRRLTRLRKCGVGHLLGNVSEVPGKFRWLEIKRRTCLIRPALNLEISNGNYVSHFEMFDIHEILWEFHIQQGPIFLLSQVKLNELISLHSIGCSIFIRSSPKKVIQ